MPVEKRPGCLFILDQCLGIRGPGSDNMTFRYRQVLLLGDDIFGGCRALSDFKSIDRAAHARDFGGHISSLIPDSSSLNVSRQASISTGQRSASRLRKSNAK